jgi:hypothetical protein
MYNADAAPEIYCELLEHKWHLSEKAKQDIGRKRALEDYKKNILPYRSEKEKNWLLDYLIDLKVKKGNKNK